jgi:hypothetical protein
MCSAIWDVRGLRGARALADVRIRAARLSVFVQCCKFLFLMFSSAWIKIEGSASIKSLASFVISEVSTNCGAAKYKRDWFIPSSSFDYVAKLFCQPPEPVEHPARVPPKLP